MLSVKATEIAKIAHGGQKYGHLNYMSHLYHVSNYLKGESDEVIAVAILHDVLEDTEITYDSLRFLIGDRVAFAVALLSDPVGLSRKERKKAVNRRIKNLPAGDIFDTVRKVKIADRLANISSSLLFSDRKRYNMYKKEHDEFREHVYAVGVREDLQRTLDSMF